jgi:hypothetical protein
MKKLYVVFLSAVAALGFCHAQSSLESVKQDPEKAAALYYVYDYKADPVLPAAPKGYKPFYISHFGRHGARYALDEYDSLAVWLDKASVADVLTGSGKKFKSLYDPFYGTVKNCRGNLTGLGKDQHRTIAARMVRRFPEVFRGDTHVEATSTDVPRVIMSMWSFLSSLQSLDRSISIDADASSKYASWLQPLSSANPYTIVGRPRHNEASEEALEKYFYEVVPCDGIIGKFFKTPDALESVLNTNPFDFILKLHAVISSTRCLDSDRTVFDGILTPEEYSAIWKAVCARHFVRLANYEGSGNLTPDYSAFTLEQIIETADSDISSGNTQLRLRFGHDSGIMPLLVFMDINGFGRSTSSFDEGIEILPDYTVPMGCSVQFVFFRNRSGNVLVQVLLNEKEVYLPVRAAEGSFYSWTDIKDFYLPRIAASKAKIMEFSPALRAR